MKLLMLQSPFYWIVIGCWMLWWASEWGNSKYFRGKDQSKSSNNPASNKKSEIGIYISLFLLFLMGEFSRFVPQLLFFGALALPLFIVGLGCIAAGFSLRWTSVYIMGKAFSRQIRTIEHQEIINTGPFAYIRHPNYLAGLLMFVGFGLLFGSWVSLIVSIIIGISPYIYRIRVEEQFLLENLTGYDSYRREVKYRLIPFIY